MCPGKRKSPGLTAAGRKRENNKRDVEERGKRKALSHGKGNLKEGRTTLGSSTQIPDRSIGEKV